MTRYVSLLGLGFGDCGKGLFTDHLCRTEGAHTVVRFNGGAQAGHNVVLPDGRHHTFSQFGASSFVPGVETLLASPVIVHPSGLLAEHAALCRAGVTDGLERLHIDARCRVTTPFHQAAGRLREWARGAQAHGSCGVGVGETVRHALEAPDEVLRYGDLTDPRTALDKLAAIRRRLQREFADRAPFHADGSHDAEAERERALLDSPEVAQRWLAMSRTCIERVPAIGLDAVADRLARPGCVVFEGAQGVLLDETYGFHPHTTWSTISTDAVEAVLRDAGIGAQVRHLGVLRSHLTRHGAGPLPTHDAALDVLAEPHNGDAGWQGRFRRGHPDALLLRYALRAAGRLDGLLVSHLDAIDKAGGLRWCDGYDIDGEAGTVSDLPWLDAPGIAEQAALTCRVARAVPRYDAVPIRTTADWLERTAAVTQLPVLLGSSGPTSADVRAMC
ncbi:MAG: adenylosuccinate synthetase [Pseudomonadota bacterium]